MSRSSGGFGHGFIWIIVLLFFFFIFFDDGSCRC
ncbi:hypothetical protein JOC26_002031 [Sporohalobacter salinus]|nr:hypothetical protein [Sporohalobacter salinus]